MKLLIKVVIFACLSKGEIMAQSFLNIKPCPPIISSRSVNVDEKYTIVMFLMKKSGRGNLFLCVTRRPLKPTSRNLLGDWHVSLLIMEEAEEDFEQNPLCINGRIVKVNSTMLLQVWNIELPELLHQTKTEIDFPTKLIQPGTWLVQSPLGGEFTGTVIESNQSYLLIMYCSWLNSSTTHLMTLALTRKNTVTSIEKLQLMSLLVKNGYNSFHNRIISWGSCN